MATTLAADRFWVDKANCHNAERLYYELLSKEVGNRKYTYNTNPLCT